MTGAVEYGGKGCEASFDLSNPEGLALPLWELDQDDIRIADPVSDR